MTTTVSLIFGVFKQTEENNDSKVMVKKKEIMNHPAWHGQLSGVKSEEILRNQPVGSYLLRQGENHDEYYLSWLADKVNTVFVHRPFLISVAQNSAKWEHKNGQIDSEEKLDSIIPKMMHRPKENCLPVLSKQFDWL